MYEYVECYINIFDYSSEVFEMMRSVCRLFELFVLSLCFEYKVDEFITRN